MSETEEVKRVMAKLKEPFDTKVIHWRVGARTSDKSKGIALAYLNSRDVMKRLDDTLGAENWQDRYPYAGCCEIGIRILREGRDEWAWKSDGAGETAVEGEKGQFSDAFKRAAVKWGIGRYLYYLPNEWVPLTDGGKKLAQIPKLPDWAYPSANNNPDPEINYTPEQQKTYNALLNGDSPVDFYIFIQNLDHKASVGLYNSFGKGKVVAGKRLHDEAMSRGAIVFNDLVSALITYINMNDDAGVKEISLELGNEGKKLAFKQLNAEQQKMVKELAQ